MDESEGEVTAEMPSSNSAAAGDVTAEMPVSDSVAAGEGTSELTIKMPGGAAAIDDEFSDLDDTGVNEELTANLPAAQNDATIEMEVESGRASSKK
jgi:hypothetical protein